MSDKVVHSWRFESGSGSNVYETLQYEDGHLSCNCMGWRIKKPGQDRTCKHCRSVEAGMADRDCVRGTSIEVGTRTPTVTAAPKQAAPVQKFKAEPVLHRKITWSRQ
jgi:hypothetical protein